MCVCAGGRGGDQGEEASGSFMIKTRRASCVVSSSYPHPPCALCCRRADVTLIMLIVNCLCLSLPPSRQSSCHTRHTKSHLFRVFRFFFSRSHRRSLQSQRRPPPWPRPPLPPPMALPCINCFLMSPRLPPLKVVAH